MLDNFLALGSTFDWVYYLVNLYKDLNNGPRHVFHIDRYCGWTGGKIRRHLNLYGVYIWGLDYTEHTITFKVREPQSKWAQYLMDREGINIVSGRIEVFYRRLV